jgi:hypothetical protein
MMNFSDKILREQSPHGKSLVENFFPPKLFIGFLKVSENLSIFVQRNGSFRIRDNEPISYLAIIGPHFLGLPLNFMLRLIGLKGRW